MTVSQLYWHILRSLDCAEGSNAKSLFDDNIDEAGKVVVQTLYGLDGFVHFEVRGKRTWINNGITKMSRVWGRIPADRAQAALDLARECGVEVQDDR